MGDGGGIKGNSEVSSLSDLEESTIHQDWEYRKRDRMLAACWESEREVLV